MPNQGMTVEPVYNDATGELQDLQVVGKHQGGTWTEEQDFIEQEDGSFRHIYQDADTNNDYQGFTWDGYVQDYIAAFPDIAQATKWAVDAPELPPGFADEFNAAIDNQDLDTFNEMSEMLLEFYNTSQMEQRQEDLGGDEEFYEQLPQEMLEQDLGNLQQQEFSLEDAETMAEVSTAYEHGSVEHAILSAGVDLAYGKADINDKIQEVVGRYGEATAVAAYYRLRELMGTN